MKTPLILLFITFWTHFLRAENVFFNISTILEEKGLFTDDVRYVYQDDEDNYLWIGTNEGLFSYDGYRVQQMYATDRKGNKQNIGLSKVILKKDSEHLYIGSSKGVFCYSKRKGILQLITGTEELEVSDMICDNQQRLWIATNSGLYLYDSLGTLKKYPVRNKGKIVLTDTKCVYIDSSQRLWVGTWEHGLLRLDESTGTFIDYPVMGKNNSPHVLFEDKDHHLLVGTWGDGLFYFPLSTPVEEVVYQNIRADEKDNGSITSDIIYAIQQDKQYHYIWIGGRYGLNILKDLRNPNSCINLSEPISNKKGTLSGKDINSICMGKNNTVWLGILGGGVNRIDFRKFQFNQMPLTHYQKQLGKIQIDQIIPLSKNKVWFSIPRKCAMAFDMQTGELENLSNKLGVIPQEAEGISKWIQTAPNEYLICLNEGMVCRVSFSDDGQLVKWKFMPQKVGRVTSMTKDKDGTVFFATKSKLGFITPDDELFFLPSSFLSESHLSFPLDGIAMDNQGDLWVASRNSFVQKISVDYSNRAHKILQIYTVENGLPASLRSILNLYVDSKNRLWMGSYDTGLLYYDALNDRFNYFDERLSSVAESVFDMIEDRVGHLWINTNKGVFSLSVDGNYKMLDLHTYDLVDGLLEVRAQRGSFALSEDGHLFWGNRRGFNSINPARIKRDQTLLTPALTSIKVANQDFGAFTSEEQHEMAEESPFHSKKIRLKYSQSNVAIEFGVVNYIKPRNLVYAYRLKGVDHDWVQIKGGNRTAVYPYLSSGKYDFLVKVSEDNITWSGEELLIQLEVTPPWWNSWVAWLFYGLILSLIFYAIYINVRNRNRLNQEVRLKELEKKGIEELTQTKLQFFTNVSHELMTPLTILSMTLEDLKQKYRAEDNSFHIMAMNIERLMRLFQQILEFRKAETRNLKLKVAYEDLAEFIRHNCHSNFQTLLQRKSIYFSVVCNPMTIKGYFDTDKMDKILYNLLSNAIKYTPSMGTIQVTVLLSEDGKQVVIKVHDTGIGIAPDKLPLIFKRFYDGEYRKVDSVGNGIGLSLTKELVELHKGSISVSSTLGRGTDFIVTLPIARDVFELQEIESDFVKKEESMPLNPLEESAAGEETLTTILLVEDNEDLLYSMEVVMQRSYCVLTARNGREALAMIEHQEIDVIVSDVVMPEIGGIELCANVKLDMRYSHIPVILLSAKSEVHDKIVGFESGADGYITKPFNLLELQAQINSLVKSRMKFFENFKPGVQEREVTLSKAEYNSIDEQFMKQAIAYVEQNISNEEFDFDLFASALCVSRSVFYRKIKSLTHTPPSEFVKKIKLGVACQILQEKKVSISEVAFHVGFSNPKYFSTLFRKEYGFSPSEYVMKHRM